MPKGMFGGRTLLPFDIYQQLRRIYFGKESVERPEDDEDQVEPKDHFYRKSYLDVIADSGTVEAYLLTKQEMQYLPDHCLASIFDAIVQIKEPDRPAKEEVILAKKEAMIKERIEKEKEVNRIIK